MGLSRLDNFLKSVRGTVIYVDPNSLDATDSIENQGNSLTRPFKTIQRALVETSRFSYQKGLDNDRFDKTTIYVYPGEHVVDNRPGWIPVGSNTYKLRSGEVSNAFGAWDLTTNYDLTSSTNALYKLNSVFGGVVVPRGCSIVGVDVRKCKIRPKYVPNPESNLIDRSAIFRITGSSYFTGFQILDADPNGVAYKDFTTNKFVPNFSHHKLTTFEFADGANNVDIDDSFISGTDGDFNRTDLDMYYEKVGLAYGPASGREIEPDYPSTGLDIQPKIDEYRIVGSKGVEVGITSIRAGDGTTSDTTITVTLAEAATAFDVDTPIRIESIGSAGYDGQFVISRKVNATNIEYKVQNSPADPLPSVVGSTITIAVDTVTSASPYIFNCSQKSVYGMNGLHADGDKADGFKSMVCAQFTGIGLQKDNNAFVKYDETIGTYLDSTSPGNENIHSDSRARFKPDYANFHIKASNGAVIQIASVFAIGYAKHFLAETGGDMSITNSNSNFGAHALYSSGFRKNAYSRDDIGYFTHIIPPKENENKDISLEFNSIDVNKTVGVGTTNRLYLYNQTNLEAPPDTIVDGYRVGAKNDELLNVSLTSGGISTTYSARVVMPNTQFSSNEVSSQKEFTIGRAGTANSITSNTLTFTENHSLINGEKIRLVSQNGHIPDGLTHNTVYFAITTGLNADQIKIAQTLNDTITSPTKPVEINSNGGVLTIESRVSDKKSGDIGHPIQYDAANSQWYTNVATAATERSLYDIIVGVGSDGLGSATPRSFITRKPDTRTLDDTLYRYRYVLSKDSSVVARPPIEGYIIEKSSTSIGSTDAEVAYLYSPTTTSLSNSTQLRSPRYIADANWSSNVGNIVTEIPHDLTVGSSVEIVNIKTSTNSVGVANSAFNGTFTVTGISSAKQFSISIPTNPGTFSNDVSVRTTSLPNFKAKKTAGTYQIYSTDEVQEYVPSKQDGIYHIAVVNSSNKPAVAPFSTERYTQPIQNLYPQTNRDNPSSDPQAAESFALSDPIGQVVINEPQKSITKESLNKRLVDVGVGFGLTDVKSGTSGTTHTLYTDIDHGLNRITNVDIFNAGANYVDGSYYNAKLVSIGASTTGKYATARVTVSSGSVTSVKIIDGGSAYGIGNTVHVTGVTTSASNTKAVLKVSSIYNNIGDTLSITGLSPDSFNKYDSLYQVTSVGVGSDKEISVSSASTISSPSTTGIGVTVASTGNVRVTGNTLNVYSIVYDGTVGLATVLTHQTHGLQVDNKIQIGGADSQLLNGSFVIKKVGTTTSFVANVGVSTITPVTTGNMFVYPTTYSSQGGNVAKETESTSGRLMPEYAGITTVVSGSITDSATTIGITSVSEYNLDIGDYLMVDNEIMRVKSTVSSDSITVFRGLLGTLNNPHNSGAVVRRIKPNPVEFHRTSLLRASGHTFEYLGYGPGNYSTALPERQDRNISPQEEILAQATLTDGGNANYTAMNADGNLYTRNKKVSAETGQEERFNTPIPTVTGEDPGIGVGVNVGFGLITPQEITVNRSLRVEGGPDSNMISEFDGPVIFNDKISSNSPKGIEANSLFLQGDQTISRKYTVGISTPTAAGNVGDVVYNTSVASGGFLGWVYSSSNRWEKFSKIGANGAEPSAAIGIASGGNYVGLATQINVVGAGITVKTVLDATVCIATLTLDANPRVAISTGTGNNFTGIATQLNFIGYGVTVRTEYADANTGIATVIIDSTVGLGSTTQPGGNTYSLQYNNNGFFGGGNDFIYDGVNVSLASTSTNALFTVKQFGTGNALEVHDSTSTSSVFSITGSGSVGIGSSVPSAKLEVNSASGESIRVKSTSGSGNIVRVDKSASDTTPFIVDTDGQVGVNTVTARDALDVYGTVAVGNTVAFYNDARTYYASLTASSTLAENVSLTLPTKVGAASSVLYTTGSGQLSWISMSGIATNAFPNTDSLAEGSANLYFTDERAQDTIGDAINSGIQTGIKVTYNDTANSISFDVGNQSPYPFTTKGFIMPL